MLATLAILSLSAPLAQQQTMTLALKAGDTLAYSLEIKSTMMGIDATGKLPLTVAKKDGGKLTLSWPQVGMTNTKGNFSPIEAGTAVITDKGAMVQPDPKGQAVMFLMPWALPEKAVVLGGTFKVPGPPGPVPLDLTGKFEKLAGEGALAVIVVDGTMSAQGGSMKVHWESNFDLKRGIFRSGILTLSSQEGQAMSSFAFKLVE